MGLGPEVPVLTGAARSAVSSAGDVDPPPVRVTLRPLRSEERVRLYVEYGCRVGEVRRLAEQKYGLAAPAKLLRQTKQRAYISCEDSERIKQDRTFYIKDIDWIQDPSAPIRPLVAKNPGAFVDPPKWQRAQPESEEDPSPTSKPDPQPSAAEAEALVPPAMGKELSYFRVVHTHVWVRVAPNVEARRLGLLQRDHLVSGRAIEGWLLLDGVSRRRMGESAAQEGPAWVLIDGRDFGYGVLLDPVAAVDAEAARRRELLEEAARKEAAAAGESIGMQARQQAVAGLAGVPEPPAFTAASWLLVPDEAVPQQRQVPAAFARKPAVSAKPPEPKEVAPKEVPKAPAAAPPSKPAPAAEPPQESDMAALLSRTSQRFEALGPEAREVLLELLSSGQARSEAREAVELLYSYERLKELRAAQEASVAVPKGEEHQSDSSTQATEGVFSRQLSKGSSAAGDAEGPPAKENGEPVSRPSLFESASAARRMGKAKVEDPLRLTQVYTVGWRYGDWYQDTDRFRQRAPFGMLRGVMDEDLLAYLMDRAPFNAVTGEAHAAMRKRYRIAKEKFEGKSEFLKADWHTVPKLPEVAEAFIPRHGARGPAIRAPDHVIAFTEAFRDVNVHAWHALAARLRGGMAPKGREELEGLGAMFADAIEQRRHFGAVEMQHFAGGAFEGKRHLDGCTSALHLAVSLSGKRFLHVQSALNKSAPLVQDEVFEMLPGDVYLSSPAVFHHKVAYPSCEFKEAMVSLHMRFLFEPHWYLKKFVNHQRDNDMREVAAAVADVLTNHRIRLPNLQEVMTAEAKLHTLGRL